MISLEDNSNKILNNYSLPSRKLNNKDLLKIATSSNKLLRTHTKTLRITTTNNSNNLALLFKTKTLLKTLTKLGNKHKPSTNLLNITNSQCSTLTSNPLQSTTLLR